MFYMITQNNCPWCEKAEEFICELNEGTESILSWDANTPLTRRLMLKAGLRTVPQIWKDDEYIGGYQELVAYFEQQKDETQ